MSTVPKPVFVYGMPQYLPRLAFLLTGIQTWDAAASLNLEGRLRKATVSGHKRYLL